MRTGSSWTGSVWDNIDNNGASGDDDVFVLTTLSSGCWRCIVVTGLWCLEAAECVFCVELRLV